MKLFDMLFKRKDKSEKLQVVQADEKESAEVVQQLSADKDNTDETIDSNEPQKNIQTEKKYSVEGSDGNALPQELIRKLMADKEKQNICKSELYEACLKLHCELSAYTDSLSDLSELVGECFMPAPIADPEVSDYIERCFHVSSGYTYRAKDLLGMLDAYINQCLKDAEIKDLTTYVEQSKRFMKSISENYPSEGDIQNLKNMIVECIMIVNRLCSQKWQGGESGFRIDTVGSLEERHKQLSGLIERVKYLLNRYIDELSVTMKREISMACVYASPEVMMGTSPMFSPIEKDQTYPYIHSFSDTISDTPEASMACVYASPEMMRSKKGFLNKLFKRND